MLYIKPFGDNVYKQWELGQVMVIRLVTDFGGLVKVALKGGAGKRVGGGGRGMEAAGFPGPWVYFCCCSGGACVRDCRNLGLFVVGTVG
jgi:hypothetical protein